MAFHPIARHSDDPIAREQARDVDRRRPRPGIDSPVPTLDSGAALAATNLLERQ